MTAHDALRIPGARPAIARAERRSAARRSLKRAAVRHLRHLVVEVQR